MKEITLESEIRVCSYEELDQADKRLIDEAKEACASYSSVSTLTSSALAIFSSLLFSSIFYSFYF